MSAYGKHKATAHRLPEVHGVGRGAARLADQGHERSGARQPVHRPDARGRSSPTCRSCSRASRPRCPRPVTPFYPAVTKAIETNVYAALQGQKSSEQALKDIQAAINSAAGGGG